MKNQSLAFILLIGYLLTDCSGQKISSSQISSNKVATITEEKHKKTVDESSITDIDGNRYAVVQIGNQFWMKTNLKVSNYINGNPILHYSGGVFLKPTDKGMFALYDNDSINEESYGKLYNYYAVVEGSLCPAGWHVPSEEEWQEMINSGGGALMNLQAGGAMNPQQLSPFYDIDTTGYWWTSTSVGRNTAAYFSFQAIDETFKRNGANEGCCFSVRCVKN